MSPRVVIAAVLVALAAATPAAARDAPGAPGSRTTWAPANKTGFGTSSSLSSKVWFTLGAGKLTEVYYPNLGTPSVRDLEFVVSDGRTFTERERSATRRRVEPADPHSLTYRQVNTAKSGAYRITKTYVTDPGRNTLLIDVSFESLTGKPYIVYALYDPALSNNGRDDSAITAGRTGIAFDAKSATALEARPAFQGVANGFLGRNDGWRALHTAHPEDHRYSRALHGNVVQTALTPLDGRTGHQHLTLALGFGRERRSARQAARGSLDEGFGRVSGLYANGWQSYLGGLKPAPASTASMRAEYDASLMLLAAHEDKTFRGASVASPTMPWAWGDSSIEHPSGAYHLVWPRDLYQVATAQLVAGDRAAAERELTYMFNRQQLKDGSFPQNSEVSGKQHWDKTQMDEVAFPVILAWQLQRFDARTYRDHVRRAAEFIARKGPWTEQERWENQSGWSPATMAAEIAGLVCAADIARRNGAATDAGRYERLADSWRGSLERVTATSTGPYSPKPYFLRIAKRAKPNRRVTYDIGDSGPSKVDHRRVVDPSFLELVRLGVKRPDDRTVVNTIGVMDAGLRTATPTGTFWHRFSFDGYGEDKRGGPWGIGKPDSFKTFGRAWPIFAGERGEYELAAGRSAADRLASMAGAANEGLLIPEQVWDGRAPTGRPAGEGTLSATPLAWSHAQFVRLAWSIDAGRPVETPSVVSCRYAVRCP